MGRREERESECKRERRRYMCMSGREREYKKVYLLPISVIERVEERESKRVSIK